MGGGRWRQLLKLERGECINMGSPTHNSSFRVLARLWGNWSYSNPAWLLGTRTWGEGEDTGLCWQGVVIGVRKPGEVRVIDWIDT